MSKTRDKTPGFNADFALDKERGFTLYSANEKMIIRFRMGGEKVIPQAYILPPFDDSELNGDLPEPSEIDVSEQEGGPVITDESGCFIDPELGEICP